MKRIFHIDIGVNEETGIYRADVISTEENKGVSIEAMSLKNVMMEVSKKVRKRVERNKKFPLQEPPRILTMDQAGMGTIVTPRTNGHV